MYKIPKIRKLIEKSKKEWNVPGVAAAVIKDNEVIFSECFGVRDLEKNLEVTPDTVFPIASTTKTFASATLAILADERKLEWDKPIKEYIPNFKLYDEYASNHATIRDMASHRTGLPRHDLMIYGADFTAEEILERLRYLEPTKELRQVMQYQNHMYILIGHLVEKLSGMTWNKFVEEKILKLLSMNNTNFLLDDLKKLDNYSMPYAKLDGEVKRIPFSSCDRAGSAGCINSSLNDMIKWVMLHLNKGKFKGNQIIKEENVIETHTPQSIIRDFYPWEFEEVDFSTYGMGWFVESYRGHKIVHHGGTIDGFKPMISFMPKENIGIVVLSNLNRTAIDEALVSGIYDILLDMERIDWDKRYMDEMIKLEKESKEQIKQIKALKKEDIPLTHKLEAFAGEYEHFGYGKLRVKKEDDKLKMYFNEMVFSLEHFTHNTFFVKEDILEFETHITFIISNIGDIEGVLALFESSIEKGILFKKSSL